MFPLVVFGMVVVTAYLVVDKVTSTDCNTPVDPSQPPSLTRRMVCGAEDAAALRSRAQTAEADAVVARAAAAVAVARKDDADRMTIAAQAALREAQQRGDVNEAQRLRDEADRIRSLAAQATADAAAANQRAVEREHEAARATAERIALVERLTPERVALEGDVRSAQASAARSRASIDANVALRAAAVSRSDARNYVSILGYRVNGESTTDVAPTLRVVIAESEEGRTITATRAGTVTITSGNTTMTRSGAGMYPDVLIVTTEERRAANAIHLFTLAIRGEKERETGYLLEVTEKTARIVELNRQMGATTATGGMVPVALNFGGRSKAPKTREANSKGVV